MADTNTQRFMSGRETVEAVLSRAEADNVGALVISPGRRFASSPVVTAWLSQRGERVSSYPDNDTGVVEVWRVKP